MTAPAPERSETPPETDADFIIIGSGAGALTGAIIAHDLGARVLVVEKSTRYGGTSAMSGGAIWAPCNRALTHLGLTDSRDAALRYLTEATEGRVDPRRIEAFIDHVNPMIEAITSATRLRFEVLQGYPDYYSHLPGASPSGRTLGAVPWWGLTLGRHLRTLHPPHPQMSMMGSAVIQWAHEAAALVSRTLPARLLGARRLLASLARKPLTWLLGADPYLTVGQALIGRLRAALADRHIPLWLSTPALELTVHDGRVTGVIASRAGRPIHLRACRGVLLAAGGFARDPALLQAHQRQPARPEWSASTAGETGDPVRMARQVGAELEFMDSALWAPVSVVPGKAQAYILALERCLPGSLVVDRSGRRFADESMPFPDFARLMLDRADEILPAYIIAGRDFRFHYMLGAAPPAIARPDFTLGHLRSTGYLRRHATLKALAEAHGMIPETLIATVERFNHFARVGIDEDFRRGTGWIQRFYGDAAIGPDPTMAPIDRGPFYAIDVMPGNLGTLGGLRVDPNARVLRPDGSPVPGLYAAGNCASPFVGYTYPASGLTLGPAMTSAYLAARHACREEGAPP